MHDDIAYPVELPTDLKPTLAVPVAGLPVTAPKKSINEKALLAVQWLDRAFFTSDPLVATLFRFFALEALLGDVFRGPQERTSCPPADDAQPDRDRKLQAP